VNAGQTVGLGTVNDYDGRQTVDSLYAEVALPITDTFNLQVAARYEDYDVFDNISPKIAGLWAPTDNLILRASWSQSFKAPGIVHLASESIFTGGAAGNVTVDNISYGSGTPFCTRDCAIRGSFIIRADPTLQPQESDNISVGFDYNLTDNISFGASWISIEFTDRIANPNMPTITGTPGCYRRDPTTGIPILGPIFPPETDPNRGAILYEDDPTEPGFCVELDPGAPDSSWANVSLLISNPSNQDFQNVEAVDLRATMFWDTGIGQVSFTPNVSVFTKYEYPTTRNSDQCPDLICDGVGRTAAPGSTGFSAIPRWQGTFATALSFGNHNIRVTPRYTDGINPQYSDLSAEAQQNFVFNDGLWLVDVNWAWQLSASATFSASIRNLFAEEPPPQNAEIFNRNRRTFSIQYQHSFAN